MTTEIKTVDGKHLVIIETNITERLIAKVTLEAQKTTLLAEIAEIDAQLALFIEP